MKRRRTAGIYFMIILLILAVWIPACVVKMNREILNSAQLSGVEIARRLAANELNYSAKNEAVLNMMEIGLRPENRQKDMAKWFNEYLEYLNSAGEFQNMEIYAAIDGRIVAASYWEGDKEFDPTQAEWYRKAIEADGAVIYTDAYTDVRLKKLVITMAKQIEGTKDVVALDIYPEEMNDSRNIGSMPERSNYFLCDSKGTLLYYVVQGGAGADVEEQFKRIFEEIRQGIHDDYKSSTVGVDGVKRGVYYYQMENGMYSILTIPYQELLAGSVSIQRLFTLMVVIFAAALVVFVVRDQMNSRKERLYNDIVRVLGNSYYALYLIDLKTDEYSMLKGSDFVRGELESSGKYSDLLNVVSRIVDDDSYQDFTESFSIDNMRKLVKKRVRDFGGDIRRKFNNEYRWVHVQMLYDESLQVNKVVLCFKDVNEAKERDLSRIKLLRDSLESVKKMSESKNMFFSSMSHDMRTPLNGIIGLAKLALGDEENTARMKDSMRKILSLGNQLLELINDILEISKMEQGKLEISGYDFDLREKLEEQLSVFRIQADTERKQFQVDIDIENDCVKGDWRRIQQILNNLLSNAFKFTGENGRIFFGVREIDDTNSRYRKYQFTVSDTGTGMSREFLTKLFEPFERETRFGAANVAGTGLGMPIVQNLVLQMSGTIEVQSELSKGSTFTVTLPLSLGEGAVKEKSSEPEYQADLSGYRVLLAEDNEINMEISTEILKMYNLDVTQAWNGKEAVDLFREMGEGFFDIILMDMQMPVMNGCDAARQIRAMKRADAATVPIIAVTANAFSEDIAATRNAGMNAHISKPIDFDVFRKTVEELLKGSRRRKSGVQGAKEEEEESAAGRGREKKRGKEEKEERKDNGNENRNENGNENSAGNESAGE